MTVGLVLAGGGALGAYEVGVLRYLVEELGELLPFQVLSGTSIGAIHVCALAAWADDPRLGVERLVSAWRSMKVDDVLRPHLPGVLSLARKQGAPRAMSLFGDEGLEQLVGLIPFARISGHIEAGLLNALCVTATQVSSGCTMHFVERSPGSPMRPPSDHTQLMRDVRIGPAHALASAAIPLLFPPVRVDDGIYCDGGLRQNVPLSPARHLGADALMVVSPRHLPREPTAGLALAREAQLQKPAFLAGKALSALMLDRIDADLDRLERINAILRSGVRRHGPGYLDDLDRDLGYAPGEGLRQVRAVCVRASQDLGVIAGQQLRAHALRGLSKSAIAWTLQWLADGPDGLEADLASYLLFDGDFAGQLIELGYADAQAQRTQLEEFFRPSATVGIC